MNLPVAAINASIDFPVSYGAGQAWFQPLNALKVLAVELYLVKYGSQPWPKNNIAVRSAGGSG